MRHVGKLILAFLGTVACSVLLTLSVIEAQSGRTPRLKLPFGPYPWFNDTVKILDRAVVEDQAGNVAISGSTLTVDGVPIGTTAPGGSSGDVQINVAGAFAGGGPTWLLGVLDVPGDLNITEGVFSTDNFSAASLGGIFRVNSYSLVLADGNNDAVPAPEQTIGIITGPTGAFAVRGITPGAGTSDHQVLILVNLTGQAMTLTHQAGGAATAQLTTSTGADIVTTANGFALLVYDPGTDKWLVIATSL